MPLPSSPEWGKPDPLPSPRKADLEVKCLQVREKEMAWEKEKLNLETERHITRAREQSAQN